MNINSFKAFANALDQQVTTLSLEGIPCSGFESTEIDSVEAADATAEDQQDVIETVEAKNAVEAVANNIESLSDEVDANTTAEVTMESLYDNLVEAKRYGGMSEVAAGFARQTLSSATAGNKLGRAAGAQLVPDLQSFGGASDAAEATEVTMLGVRSAISDIGDYIYTTTANITQHLHNWSNSLEKVIGRLGTRAAKLRGKNTTFEGNAQTKQLLSATRDNIALAQALFLGPQDHKVEGIFKRVDVLNNIIHTYMQSTAVELDSISEKIAQTAGTMAGDTIDGAIFNQVYSVASKIAKKAHTLPNGKVIHMSEELFGGEAFAVTSQKPEKTYDSAGLAAYSREFRIGMYPINIKGAATHATWHQYALRGLDKGEVGKALDKVDGMIANLRMYVDNAKKQAEAGTKLVSLGKTSIKGAGRAGRAALRAAITIWRRSCSGAHDLALHAVEVCHHLLTFVGKSVYLIERIAAGFLGDVARNAQGQHGASGLVGAVVGGTIDAVRRRRWDKSANEHAGF